ncbi:MAG: aminotransferase class I/II-fold pyridoxal phosphate-dependent enzyme [Ignavibacterium sp.]|uniref:methionine aminotransferase n=1 Tax=Ignavibacterium sp. TaxID=2651167 RepID=UPI003299B07A
MIESKLKNIGTSIFAVMTKLANEKNALNLSQGFPDFDISPKLIELVDHFMKAGKNQYAPMPGVPELRKMISLKIEKLYNCKYDFESEITITAGATQALYTAISVLINPDDEAIIFEPAYDSYAPSVIANGGKPVFISLRLPDFSIPWDKVVSSINSKTKLIIINSPHNPTGAVISQDDIKELENVVRDKNIFIISDEVYEHIVFDGNKHISICESEILRNKSFVISSFGKTFHTTGWKIGYCAAPKVLTEEFRKLHQFIVFAVNTPIQYAYAEFLKDEKNYLDVSSFYQKKRDFFLELIKDSKFKPLHSKGTYFQLLDYTQISDKDDFNFSLELIDKIGVAVIPLSPFYSQQTNNKLIRICFAKKDEVLYEASQRMKKL